MRICGRWPARSRSCSARSPGAERTRWRRALEPKCRRSSRPPRSPRRRSRATLTPTPRARARRPPQDAEKTRADAIARAQAHVAEVSRATATLLGRVEALNGETGALVDNLRAGAHAIGERPGERGDEHGRAVRRGVGADVRHGVGGRQGGARATRGPFASAGHASRAGRGGRASSSQSSCSSATTGAGPGPTGAILSTGAAGEPRTETSTERAWSR